MKNEEFKEDLPYERFKQIGANNLTNAELLAIIIRTGTKEESALEISKKILQLGNQYGQSSGILTLLHLEVSDLMKVSGIGEVKAIKIKCVSEFAKRISRSNFKLGIRFTAPKVIADYYMEMVRHLSFEQIILIMTDSKNQLIADKIISKGTVNMSIITPRELFVEAVKSGAVNIILLHNHPSGDVTPSKQDIDLTKKVMQASQIMNIPLVDHIIIGNNKYSSLKELGLL
ncbi:MAG: RadC family protein [Lachnospiraceae bacterium]